MGMENIKYTPPAISPHVSRSLSIHWSEEVSTPKTIVHTMRSTHPKSYLVRGYRSEYYLQSIALTDFIRISNIICDTILLGNPLKSLSCQIASIKRIHDDDSIKPEHEPCQVRFLLVVSISSPSPSFPYHRREPYHHRLLPRPSYSI
jgi:hypothetical protein